MSRVNIAVLVLHRRSAEIQTERHDRLSVWPESNHVFYLPLEERVVTTGSTWNVWDCYAVPCTLRIASLGKSTPCTAINRI